MEETKNRYRLLLAIIILWCAQTTFGQNRDYLYYQNLAYHADGKTCNHTAPTASLTAFLNRDLSQVLIENAPRWGAGSGPNIDGKGSFGVELGNFVDPSPKVGDSVFVVFTCNATKQQGMLSDKITAIPWYYFPRILTLSHADVPDPPQNVVLTINENGDRVISWDQATGLTYAVYRRTIQDTLADGKSRMLYSLLGEGLAAGRFVDTTGTADKDYGYIIFAKNDSGIMSSHSKEVTVAAQTFSLAVSPRATTALLTWESLHKTNPDIKGYNIYRWKPDATEELVAYAGLDTLFFDSRLQLGTTYIYRVKGRVDAQTEAGESPPISVTTLSSRDGFYHYANLKVAVVIYQKTNAGNISDSEIGEIRTMMDIGKLFFWRNSGMKLNTEFIYLPIGEYRNFGNPGDTNVGQTVDDLKALGVMNTQYDIIFRITRATSGYWSYGVMNLGLPGPTRETGFSQSEWPIGTGVLYPGHLPGINYGLTWIYVHEVQHAIDALYNANGNPEMYHGDVPWEFPIPCGEHFDFQAKMLRHFAAYTELLPNWGDIYEALDQDQDGFPDDEPLVALDEIRFGSSFQSADTDDDGYSDKQEACDGSYDGSDPTDADTDDDEAVDGNDEYPRYPIKTNLQPFTPKIDGIIEEGWPMVNDTVSYTQVGFSPKLYMCYDRDSLYLALHLPHIGLPDLSFDFHGDGWWFSSGNTFMKINPSQGTFSELRTWDASQGVKEYSASIGECPCGMWDDQANYLNHFGRRVISPQSVRLKCNLAFPVIQIELAIAKNPYAGLTLRPGDKIGLNINYRKVNNQPDQWASTFDQYSFVNFTLSQGTGVLATDDTGEPISLYTLEQNYPNPFNGETMIRYQIPAAGEIDLAVFNILGQRVRTLVEGHRLRGSYQVIWDGKDTAGKDEGSGVYFCRLKMAQGRTWVRKMYLLR